MLSTADRGIDRGIDDLILLLSTSDRDIDDLLLMLYTADRGIDDFF